MSGEQGEATGQNTAGQSFAKLLASSEANVMSRESTASQATPAIEAIARAVESLAPAGRGFVVQSGVAPTVGNPQWSQAVGDRVLVSKLTPAPLDVNRGDLVVFVDPGGWLEPAPDNRSALRRGVEEVLTFVGLLPQNAGEHLIKRVIGLGGDTVECCDAEGRIMVNGEGIDEPYLKPGVTPSDVEFAVTVPADHAWLMGDNRSNSQDSRSHGGSPGGGAVPMSNVVGNAFLVMWPVEHWTLLRNPGETFAEVPEP